MQNFNQTLDGFRLDSTAFRDEILELNREDEKLYDFVKNNSTIAKINKSSNPLRSERLSIIAENGSAQLSSQLSAYILTTDFINLLQKDPVHHSSPKILIQKLSQRYS
ncbi:MAG: hypothetical protein COV44_06595 [Deltaproteobacteria bacterium CG11_big_fil_rev_8_21_14_0_20_45_16]|nr:MAG: hypothetical protein COV44_06595 [Deltaproteobacteria bacterium CG11_big_fil_rev_8_21_14_0_20_45_16]